MGAHIIVTPEYAICCFDLSREAVYPYLEDIPDPIANWTPCSDPQRFGRTPVQERLSCMAKKNDIYLVANFGDKKRCSPSDSQCPQDGHYFYDTTVVFDPEGTLVARYHKYHLFFGETQFNVPKEPEISTFITPFGKFGIFICYDILFYNPAVTLVTQHNVDTIIFTTAWFNLLPHYSAIQFHSSWAMAMGSNLLSSNIHNTSLGMTGSGVFSPVKLGPYYYNKDADEGRLVMSELYTHPRNSTTWSPASWNLYASTIGKPVPGNNVFNGKIFLDVFALTELKETQGTATVCHNNLCCYLSYCMLEKRRDEVYILGAYDGFHGPHKVFYVEVCTLLKCSSLETCDVAAETANTKFESFSLSGTFDSLHVFPEVLLSDVKLASEMFQVLSDGRLVSHQNISSHALLSASLLGRNYKKDPTDLNVSTIT
ncbi:pantetheinase-like isoform X2 [Pseudophryne corroboree]|uniref:pantetheinase-like isoform X2 n=1 Tax=Pseudophryne corroboree TaxID=495146 RepID=UPI003081573A